MNKKGMLAQIISAFIIILIGISLIPMISTKVQEVSANISSSNVNNNIEANANKFILDSIPVLFGIGVVMAAIMVAVSALRNDTKPKRVKKGKQTYLEYVQERIEIERTMRKSHGFFWWLK